MSEIELFHFPPSHFNEKARWALDYKGLAYTGRPQLPGPHKLAMKRLSGQEQVPVMRCDGEVVAGSGAIIAHLERVQPAPPLYPDDPKERGRALEVQRWFDDEVGPAIRLALFHEMLAESRYFPLLFAWEFGPTTRFFYRLAFPVTRIVMKKEMGIDDAAAARALEVTREGFDFVAREAGKDGHLVGDRFSVADLAAAALLTPGVHPPGGPAFPQPLPARLEAWLACWADHPGSAWVQSTYERHRGAPVAAAQGAGGR